MVKIICTRYSVFWIGLLAILGVQFLVTPALIVAADDTTAPIVTIINPINGSIFELGSQIVYNYTIIDESNTTEVVYLNGSPIADTGTILGLKAGIYVLEIISTDDFSFIGSDEVTFYVEDTTPPLIQITSPLNGASLEYGDVISYAYDSSDLSWMTTVVKLNGTIIDDTGTIENLAIGSYVLTISSEDLYNNNATDEIIFFIVDTTGPQVTILSPGDYSIWELGTTVPYSYSISDLSAIMITVFLNGGEIQDIGQLTNLAIGHYTLRVEAIDEYLNLGADEIQFDIEDSIAPVVSISSPFNGSIFELGYDIDYLYTINDASPVTITVKLNNEVISDSGTLSGLAIGTYTLRVEVNDSYNTLGFDEVVFFVTDTIAPNIIFTSPVNNSFHEYGINVLYSYTIEDASPISSVVVKLNGVEIVDSGLLNNLAIGTYILSIEAIDNFNNINIGKLVFYVLDTTSPVVNIILPTNGSIFEYGDVILYDYTVTDLQPTINTIYLNNSAISDTKIITDLLPGTYVLRVEADDSYAPIGYDEVVFYVLDTVQPTINIIYPSNGSIYEYGDVVTYIYTVDDLTPTTVTVYLNNNVIPDTGVLSDLEVGFYILTIEATDISNNLASKDLFFAIVDTVNPTVSILTPPNGSMFELGDSISYIYTINDLSPIITVIIQLNGIDIPNTGVLANLGVGIYTLTVFASDIYNNIGSAEVSFSIQDSTAPLVTILTPLNASSIELGTVISYTYSIDELANFTTVVRLNGVDVLNTGTLMDLPVGVYSLVIEVTDESLNSNSDEIVFYIVDTIIPVVKILTPLNNSVWELGTDISYTYLIEDESTCIVTIVLNGIEISDSGLITGLGIGKYILIVQANDTYNSLSSDLVNFSILDSTVPIVTIITPTNATLFEFGTDVSYSYFVDELASYSVTVRLNGVEISDTGLLSGLAYGMYTLTIEVQDDSFNLGSSEIIFYVVDTTPPTVTIHLPVNGSSYELGMFITYSYSTSDLSPITVVAKLDGIEITDDGNLGALSVGNYLLRIEVTDTSNNFASDEITFSVEDTISPEISILTPANSSTFELGDIVPYAYSVNDLSSFFIEIKLNGIIIEDTGLLQNLQVGIYRLTAICTDIYGNIGSDEIIFFVFDTIAPMVTIISPLNTSSHEFGSNIPYSYQVSDLSSYTTVIRLNGEIISDTGILSDLIVGSYSLIVEATDDFNNIGTDEILFFIQDTIPPIVLITSPIDTSVFEYGEDVFYIYQIDDLSSFSVSIYLNSSAIVDTGILTSLSVGKWILRVEALDSSNNIAIDEIMFYVQDSTIPQVLITSPSNGSFFEFGDSIIYTYDVVELSGFTIVVKLNTIIILNTGILTGLTIGTHTLTVEVEDQYGNLGIDSIIIFVQDTTPPNIAILTPLNGSNYEFGSDVAYLYNIDDLSRITSTVLLNGVIVPDSGILQNLPVGGHILRIEAVDDYGNRNFVEVQFEVIDTTAPQVYFTSPLNRSFHELGEDISYTYSIIELSDLTIELKLNGITISDSGILITLPVGNYNLSIQVTDQFNNIGKDNIVFFVVDTTIPSVTINSPLNNSIFEFGTNVSYSYEYSDLSPVTIVIRLNGIEIVDVGLLTALTVGTYTLTVEIIDDYTNIGTDNIDFSVLDSTSPSVVILYPINSSIFEYGDDVLYIYQIYDLSPIIVSVYLNGSLITDSGSLTGLEVGAYILRIESNDLYNNVAFDEIMFYVQDSTVPKVLITSPSNATFFEFGSSILYSYTIIELSSYTKSVILDGIIINDTGLIDGLAVGTHLLLIEAQDVYGNLGADEITLFVQDTTKPNVSIDAPTNGSIFELGTDIIYLYSANDLSAITVTIKLNNLEIVDTGTLIALSVGIYSLLLEVEDEYNNINSDEVFFTVVDRTVPDITINTPITGTYHEFGSDVNYDYSVIELSSWSSSVYLNGILILDNGIMSSLAVGTYILNVTISDEYGNSEFSTVEFYIEDTIDPEITVTLPLNGTTYEFGTNISYLYDASDLSSFSIEVYLDGTLIPDTGSISSLGVGVYILSITAIDLYGNVNTDQTIFIIQDTTVPNIEILSPSPGSVFEYGSNVSYLYSASDLSPFTLTLYLNEEVIIDTSLLIGIAVGSYNLTVQASDEFNNINISSVQFVVIDTTAPSVLFETPLNISIFEFGENILYSYLVNDLSSFITELWINGNAISDLGLLTGLVVGNYNLTIRATDEYGNSASDTVYFTVSDTTIPNITIFTPIESEVFEFGSMVNYTYSATDLSLFTIEIFLNNISIGDTGLLTNLAVNSYLLRIAVTDIHGNLGFDEVFFLVEDRIAPLILITTPMNGIYIEFGDIVNYEYDAFDLSPIAISVKLDGFDVDDIGSFSDLAVGTYTLVITAQDIWNNTASDDIVFIVQDTVNPVVTILEPSNNTIFEFGVNVFYNYYYFDLSPTTILVILNGFSINDTGLLTGLQVGSYSLQIEITDIFGNTGTDKIIFTLIDTISPEVSFILPINNSIFEFGEVIFYEYSSADLSFFTTAIYFDSLPISDIGVLVNVAVGKHTLYIEALDQYDNFNSDEIIIIVQDTTNPIVSILTPQESQIFEFGELVYYSYQTDDLSSVTIQVFVNGISLNDTGLLLDLSVGTHIFRVEATDTSNNVAIAEISIVIADTKAPLIFILAPITGTQFHQYESITLRTHIDELANYTVHITIDDIAWDVNYILGTITGLPVGTHILNVTVIDASGNLGSALSAFEVYTLEPYIAVTLLSPNGGEVVASNTWLITWAVDNPLKLNVSFDLYYSINYSQDWVVIAENVVGTSIMWDTSNLLTSFIYQVRIESSAAFESQILTSSDISDNYFTVANRKVTIEFEIPDVLPENLPATTPGFELPILLFAVIAAVFLLRKRVAG